MKIGVAGCGSIGLRYVGWLRDLGAEVLALDTDEPRRALAREAGASKVVPCMDALLAEGPERLLVATPPSTHGPIAVASLKAGIDVLIEKPVTATIEESQALWWTASECEASAYVVCNMRYHDGVASIRDSLPLIGKPLFTRAHFGHRLSQMRPVALNVYASDASLGGGAIADCIHEFDYLRWLFGEVETVDSLCDQIGPDEISAEDYAEVRLRHRSGIHTALHLDFLMRWKRRGLEVHGTDGSLIWNSEGRQPEHCTVRHTELGSSRVILDVPDLDGARPYRRMLAAFLDRPDELQTLAEGIDALSAALAARMGGLREPGQWRPTGA